MPKFRLGYPLDNRPDDRREGTPIRHFADGDVQEKHPAVVLVDWQAGGGIHHNTLGQRVRLAPGSGASQVWEHRPVELVGDDRWLQLHELPEEEAAPDVKALYANSGRSDGAACAVALTRQSSNSGDAKGPTVLISCAVSFHDSGFHGMRLEPVVDPAKSVVENQASLRRKWSNTRFAVELCGSTTGALVLCRDDARLLHQDPEGEPINEPLPLSRLASLPPGTVSLVAADPDDAPHLAYLFEGNADLFVAKSASGAYLQYQPPAPDLRDAIRNGTQNPFKGLESFEANAADHELVQFARREHLRQLLDTIERHALVFLWGKSGAGKTSLLQAGVAFELGSRQDWRALVMRPGTDALEQLCQRLCTDLELGFEPVKLRDLAESSATALQMLLEKWCNEQTPRRQLLLLVDQAEQLFTVSTDEQGAAVSRRFGTLLGALTTLRRADGQPLVRCVLGGQEGYLDDLKHLPGLDPKQQPQQTDFHLRQLGDEELTAALEGPMQLSPCRMEPEVVQTMVKELRHQPAQLALLQCCARHLWQQHGRTGTRITEDNYRQLGGVQQAFVRHAEDALHNAAKADQDVAMRLLTTLVARNTELAVVAEEELLQRARAGARGSAVLRQLVQSRLVTQHSGEDQRSRAFQLTHRALITHWPRLQSAIRESSADHQLAEELKARAARYSSARPKRWGDHLSGTALATCLEHEVALRQMFPAGTPEAGFLDASIRLRRLVRTAVLGLAAILVVFSAVAVWGRFEARRQAQVAREQTERYRMEMIQHQSTMRALKDTLARLDEKNDQANAASRSLAQAKYGLQAFTRDALTFIDTEMSSQRPASSTSDLRVYRSLLNVILASQKKQSYADREIGQQVEKLLDKLAKQSRPLLNKFIRSSRSMDAKEQRYWLDKLPTIAHQQTFQLINILVGEQEALGTVAAFARTIGKWQHRGVPDWGKLVDKTLGFYVMHPSDEVRKMMVGLVSRQKILSGLLAYLKKCPDGHEGWFLVGYQYYRRKKYEEARPYLLRFRSAGGAAEGRALAALARYRNEKDRATKKSYLDRFMMTVANTEALLAEGPPGTPPYSTAKAHRLKAVSLAERFAADEDPDALEWQVRFAKPLASLLHEGKDYQAAAKYRGLVVSITRKLLARELVAPNILGKELGNLSWDQLFARQFKEAVASASEGTKWAPDATFVFGNLAHGYLLSGELEKAKAIYLEHLDEEVSGQSWQAITEKDFQVLTMAGIAHPRMPDILRLMRQRSREQDAALERSLGVTEKTSLPGKTPPKPPPPWTVPPKPNGAALTSVESECVRLIQNNRHLPPELKAKYVTALFLMDAANQEKYLGLVKAFTRRCEEIDRGVIRLKPEEMNRFKAVENRIIRVLKRVGERRKAGTDAGPKPGHPK